MSNFLGLKQGIFQFVSDTSGKITLHLFYQLAPLKSQKAPRKLKNCIFGQILNSSLIFDPLPLSNLGLSFKFNYTPDLVIIEVGLAKISFSKLMPIQSYGGKTFRGRLNPPLV